MFFYRFKFFDKNDKLIGSCQNLSEKQFQDSVVKMDFKFVKKNSEYQFINDDEIITAVKLGMRKTSSIVTIQFILARI